MSGILEKNAVPLIDVQKSGTLVGSQPAINLIPGSNVTLTVADNEGGGRVDITVDASVDTSGLVPSTRTINGHALSSDIDLSASDVGAIASGTTTAGISDSSDKRYVTDAELAVIGATSGTNTGDQDLSGLVPKTTEINGKPLSANITLTASDVGAGPSDFQPALVAGNLYSSRYPQDAGVSDENILYAVPIWFSHDQTFTSISVLVGQDTDGALCRVGFYENGSNNRPGALKVDLGELDCSTSGLKTITADLSLLANTLYWGALVLNVSGSLQGAENYGDFSGRFGFISTDEMTDGQIFNTRSFTYGALPDPFGDVDGTDAFPGIFLSF